MNNHSAQMARAVELGTAARRVTPPNPWVGCVVVKDGVTVGEGATRPPGQAHAEIVALGQAGDRARGATAVVTLEPCAFHGRTGPCADALLAAGVARVVVALEDPDPRVSGQGIARLRAAGVPVDVGVGADAAAASLAPYLHHRRTGRAYAVVKTALTIDGRAAAADGSSRWITGPEARADAHDLRADSQAVVVGAGTALADRPHLTVRDARRVVGPPPLRVLLDARGRVPADGPLFDVDAAPTLVVTTDAAPSAAVDAWRAAGAKVETVPVTTGGVDLPATLSLLGGLGVLQATFEGGPTLHGALLASGLADRMVVYVGAALLGTEARPAVAWRGAASIDDAARFRLLDVTRLGDDVRLDYLPAPGWARGGAPLMFTGIVEELGMVRAVEPRDGGARLTIDCDAVLTDASLGASIAVNGCCLTVAERGERWWAAHAQVATLVCTTLGALAPGDPVNLERPVRISDRLGGHMVQGHVDGVATVTARHDLPDGSARLAVGLPAGSERYVVERGSVTLDGVSLTVAALEGPVVTVALIPHTLAVTTLGVRRAGDRVNLEVDVLAKYVERLLVTSS